MAISLEQVKEIIKQKAPFDMVAAGMWQRYLLQPATHYEWDDPKTADGIPIYARPKLGPQIINNRLHIPFDKEIVNNKASYFASNIETIFDEDIPPEVSDFYRETAVYDDINAAYSSMARYAADTGTSYALLFKDGVDVKVKVLPSWNTVVKHDDRTGKPVYGIHYNDDRIFVYDGLEFIEFGKTDRKEWTIVDRGLHGFGTTDRPGIPIVEFPNNPERIGNATTVINLCDGFDQLLSDLSSEIGQLRLSYLLLKGLGQDGAKIAEQMKSAGIILVDSGDGDAKFITKNINPAAIELLKDTLRRLIFEGANSYDPSSFTGGTPPTAEEVQARLHSLEMDAETTIGEWRRGFKYTDYLIQNFLMLFHGVSEYNLFGIHRLFRRVVPKNAVRILSEANQAGIILSNRTKIEQSGLQIDPIEEAIRIEAEGNTVTKSEGDGQLSLDMPVAEDEQ